MIRVLHDDGELLEAGWRMNLPPMTDQKYGHLRSDPVATWIPTTPPPDRTNFWNASRCSSFSKASLLLLLKTISFVTLQILEGE